MDMFVSRARSY